MYKKNSIFFFLLLLLISQLGFSATWQNQAERLQVVNATLLDSAPIEELLPTGIFYLQFVSTLAIVPKVNSTVGSKTEDIPSPPVHSVPQLKLTHKILRAQNTSVYLRAWVGYLPNGAEKLLAMDASFKQSIYGASLVVSQRTKNFRFYFPLGFQQSNAELQGAITSSTANDNFTVDSKLIYTGFGMASANSHFWGNLLAGKKKTRSTFFVEEDKTTFTLDDELEDSSFPFYVQGSIGKRFGNLNLAVAQIYVPKRLTMTKFMVSYGIGF